MSQKFKKKFEKNWKNLFLANGVDELWSEKLDALWFLIQPLQWLKHAVGGYPVDGTGPRRPYPTGTRGRRPCSQQAMDRQVFPCLRVLEIALYSECSVGIHAHYIARRQTRLWQAIMFGPVQNSESKLPPLIWGVPGERVSPEAIGPKW